MNSFNSMQRNIIQFSRPKIEVFFSTGITFPCALFIDTSHNLYFANGRVVNASTGYLAMINTVGTPTLTNLPTLTPAPIVNFVGGGIDSSNSLYPTSYSNNMVYKYDQGATTLTNLKSYTGADAVAVDNSGNVFIASYTGNMSLYLSASFATERVLIRSTGTTTYTAAVSGTTKASALKGGQLDCLVINNNRLYVCDGTSGCIYYFILSDIIVNFGNSVMYKFAGTGTYGIISEPIPVNTQATESKISDSYGICFDGVGNAYFTEWTGKMIKKVTTSGVITTLVGPATVTPNIIYDFKPLGICISNLNNYMYISDTISNSILVIKDY
jgi:hypothetical protein